MAAFLFASGGALAYEQFRGEEGTNISIQVDLPSFPHEARRVNRGYSGVRYSICTSDGTATGAMWSGFFGGSTMPGMDYLGFCNFKVQFTSTDNYTKYLKLSWPTSEDEDEEGDEYFWIKLTDPQVRRPGSNEWKDHKGSHHVPSTISVQVIIEDDD